MIASSASRLDCLLIDGAGEDARSELRGIAAKERKERVSPGDYSPSSPPDFCVCELVIQEITIFLVKFGQNYMVINCGRHRRCLNMLDAQPNNGREIKCN